MTLIDRTATPAATAPGRAARITGWVLTSLVALFLLFDSATKLLQLPAVVEATLQMGFPATTVPVIGGRCSPASCST